MVYNSYKMWITGHVMYLSTISIHFSNIQYIERDSTEHFHTLKVFPDSLTKKVTLLKYFRNYMSEHLLKVCVHNICTSCILNTTGCIKIWTAMEITHIFVKINKFCKKYIISDYWIFWEIVPYNRGIIQKPSGIATKSCC